MKGKLITTLIILYICFIRTDVLQILEEKQDDKMSISLIGTEIVLSIKKDVNYGNSFTFENIIQQQDLMKVFDTISEVYLHINQMIEKDKILLTPKGNELEVIIPLEIEIKSIEKIKSTSLILLLKLFQYMKFSKNY